jgi:hypothetical protein
LVSFFRLIDRLIHPDLTRGLQTYNFVVVSDRALIVQQRVGPFELIFLAVPAVTNRTAPSTFWPMF